MRALVLVLEVAAAVDWPEQHCAHWRNYLFFSCLHSISTPKSFVFIIRRKMYPFLFWMLVFFLNF